MGNTPIDPFWPKVRLLLGFNGADAAVATTDEAMAQVITFAGTAQLDTAQKKFGTASLFLDGNSDYVSAPDAAWWPTGTADFTIEAWVRFASVSGTQTIWGHYSASDVQRSSLFYYTASTLNFLYSTDGTGGNTVVFTVAWAPVIDTWYHVVSERDGTRLRQMVDGVVLLDSNIGTASIFDVSKAMNIGTTGNSTGAINFWNGWIDEFRVTSPIARYRGPYTVPTAAFPRCGPPVLKAYP